MASFPDKTTRGYLLTRRLATMGVAASQASDLFKFTNQAAASVASVLPYAGMVQGGLGAVSSLFLRPGQHSDSNEIMLALLHSVANGILFAKSYQALNTGAMSGVFWGMAITNALSTVTCIYRLAQEQKKINYGDIRPYSYENRNVYLTASVINAISTLGWVSLYIGNPVAGTALLSISALYNVRQFQQEYAPNMFSLFSKKADGGDRQADVRSAPVTRTAPGFSPAK